MKKFLYSLILIIIIAAISFCVYLVGGMAGAYAWTFALFIAGPAGVLLLIIQAIRLIVHLIKRKSVGTIIVNIAASALLAFPILILTGIVFVPYPANASASDALTISMPVDGEVVPLGGSTFKTHAIWPSERYAFDILAEPYDTGSTDLASYGIYGRDIKSPVNGEVVEAHDGEEDIVPNSEEFTSSMGNYIIIKVEGTGGYLILAHLQKGSVKVETGATVETGTALAKVGNSGTTSEPHLHIQYQKNDPRSAIFAPCSEGLPIIFK